MERLTVVDQERDIWLDMNGVSFEGIDQWASQSRALQERAFHYMSQGLLSLSILGGAFTFALAIGRCASSMIW